MDNDRNTGIMKNCQFKNNTFFLVTSRRKCIFGLQAFEVSKVVICICRFLPCSTLNYLIDDGRHGNCVGRMSLCALCLDLPIFRVAVAKPDAA